MAVRAHPDFGLRTMDLGLLRTVRVLCKAIYTPTHEKKLVIYSTVSLGTFSVQFPFTNRLYLCFWPTNNK